MEKPYNGDNTNVSQTLPCYWNQASCTSKMAAYNMSIFDQWVSRCNGEQYCEFIVEGYDMRNACEECDNTTDVERCKAIAVNIAYSCDTGKLITVHT